ncbi:MAG: transposase, partial [Anaerolineales bacterium]|nr:transposase [Anaerolineales bacterium]
MTQKRKQYNMQFKFKVALDAAKGVKTINQLASDYDLHPNQVSNWKKQLLEEGPGLFNRQLNRRREQQAAQEAELYEQIGRLKMELEWL